MEQVKPEPLKQVDAFNHRRLPKPTRNIPPMKPIKYCAKTGVFDGVAVYALLGLRQTRVRSICHVQ